MKRQKLYDKVWLVSFETQEDLSFSFLRFQEFYESPRFKGQIFSFDSFKEWYTLEYGEFSYVKDWSGFNIPSSILTPFKEGKFDPLSDREIALISAFKDEEHPFYIIGTNDGSDALEHEICHALFYTDQAYAKQVILLLTQYHNELSDVRAKVLSLGYHPDVLDDEVHAYVSANPDWLTEQNIAFPVELTVALRDLKRQSIQNVKI